MTPVQRATGWQRHLWYRKEILKTTWKLRLLVLLGLLLLGMTTRASWTQWLAKSLVCREEQTPSDAILVENFDTDYLVFERAAALMKAGLAPRVLLPLWSSDEPPYPNLVSQGISDVMIRVARMPTPTIIPIQAIEPISLNAVLQIRTFLEHEQIRSLLVVAPGFRSQRSALVYRAVLNPAGIAVSCVPVFGQKTPEHWTVTWHGIQDVTEQWLKLQYYRVYVLRTARVPGTPALAAGH